MSFDFGDSNKASDPTADFTSKFPSLDGDDGDAALSGVGGAGTGGVPPALDDFENDLLGGGSGAATRGTDGAGSQFPDLDSPPAIQEPAQPRDDREQFESQFPELDDPDIGGGTSVEAQPTVSVRECHRNGNLFTQQTFPFPLQHPVIQWQRWRLPSTSNRTVQHTYLSPWSIAPAILIKCNGSYRLFL